jgi:hypothetical protein
MKKSEFIKARCYVLLISGIIQTLYSANRLAGLWCVRVSFFLKRGKFLAEVGKQTFLKVRKSQRRTILWKSANRNLHNTAQLCLKTIIKVIFVNIFTMYKIELEHFILHVLYL